MTGPMVDMTMAGDKAVLNLLKKVGTTEVAKITRKTTRETVKNTVLPAAKRNAAGMVGGRMGALIAKALTVRAMVRMRKGHYGAKVLIKANPKFIHETADGRRSFIPKAIEYGHAHPGRGGKNAPKDVGPIPFLRKAFDANRRSAGAVFALKFRGLLNQTVRLLRKGK